MAINASIRKYETQRFHFNETVTSLVCVPGSELVAKPANFFFEDYLECIQSGSNNLEILKSPFRDIRRMNIDTSTGLPTRYCSYGDNFLLANRPDSAYPVNCYYVMKLPELSADTDTNDWLSAHSDLIVYCAAKMVWATTIRNASAASVCASFESEYLQSMNRYREQEQANRIEPTQF